jgi:polyhydroxybutyrate depolymerase
MMPSTMRSSPMPAARATLHLRLTCLFVVLFGALGALRNTHATQDAEPPRPAPDRTVTVQVGEAERRAIVVNAPAEGTKSPAVIVLHGGAGSAEQMRASSGFDPVAREHGFMAVYAEGTEFGVGRNAGRHAWNTGHLLRRQVRDADDIAYFDALIDRLIAEHGADPERIFMTGGSNGGMMTFVYGAARAERLAAIAPVVASMFTFDTTPKVPLPILIINGAKDEEVPLAGGMSENAIVRAAQATPFKPLREVVEFWVKANRSKTPGASKVAGTVTTTTYAASEGEGEGGATTEFILDSAGGHGWPGTSARRGDNTPITAFRGAERVWEFFQDKVRKPDPKPDPKPGTKPDPTPAATPKPAAPAEVRVLDFPDLRDEARKRAVPITVHLPAGAGPFPVVVVSHGAGGDRATHFGQAQDLAQNGYAVLCIEHVGSNRARLSKAGIRMMQEIEAMTRDADEVLARPRDISFALDRATEWNASHATLKAKLDVARAGAMGHSFGAYTTMVVCGMRPALDWLTPRIDPGKGLGPDLCDPRIRCGVAFSPQSPGEPFFLAESFASLRAPLLGMTGSKDTQQAGRTAADRKAAFALWPKGEHLLVWLSNARHNDFTSSSGDTGRSLPSATREDVQPVARAATRAFFDLHLKSDAAAADRLSATALQPFLRGEINAVEVLRKERAEERGRDRE